LVGVLVGVLVDVLVGVLVDVLVGVLVGVLVDVLIAFLIAVFLCPHDSLKTGCSPPSINRGETDVLITAFLHTVILMKYTFSSNPPLGVCTFRFPLEVPIQQSGTSSATLSAPSISATWNAFFARPPSWNSDSISLVVTRMRNFAPLVPLPAGSYPTMEPV